MSHVRVALAGYGRFGARHADVIERSPNASLVGVAEPDAAATRRLVQAYPDVAHFEDAVAMMDETAPDAVLVVSPEATHAGITSAAFERGIHVLAEKPLATEVDDAHQLVSEAERRGLVYQVGYLLRYEPRHALLKERIARGVFGRLATIRAKRSCSRTWFEAYGARIHPVYETLVHDIDLILWMSDQRCLRVQAWQRSFLDGAVPETLVVVLELSDGTLAQLESVWLVPEGAPWTVDGWGEGGGEGNGTIDAALELMGTEAMGSVTTYEGSLTVHTRETTTMPDASMWPEVGGVIGGALREELSDFVDRVCGNPGRGVASIRDALHVQEIADAVVTSGSEGRPVELDGAR